MHEGQYYIGSLIDSLKGIKIAHFKWVIQPELEKAAFDFDAVSGCDGWKLKSGDLKGVFAKPH